jgi:hypothetical protein
MSVSVRVRPELQIFPKGHTILKQDREVSAEYELSVKARWWNVRELK